jgi:exodeoxyribonuclease V beta subunit
MNNVAPVATALDVFSCPLHGTRLIEASAGTGKTWNICGLVLRLLLERGLAVQQILVVTFTNAATAELRDRVRARIAETLARLRGGPAPVGDTFVDQLLNSLRSRHGLADADMAAQLDLALQTFDEAAIFTIHGFCQRALSDTPFSAGLPLAQAQLADDGALRQEVVQDFWRRNVAGADLPPALATQLLQRGDSPQRWGQLLQRQLAKPLSTLVWPAGLDQAPNKRLAELQADLNAAHQAARGTWQTQRADVVALVQAGLPQLNGVKYKPATVAEAEADWQAWLSGSDALAASAGLKKLHLFTTDSLQPKKNCAPLPPHPFFEQASHLLSLHAELQQALQHARLRLLRQLLEEAPAQLRTLKRERRVLAFDDLLFNLYDRLTSGEQPGLAAALRARYPAALIDEFQDTDPLQFNIFKALYAAPPAAADPPPALFLVGDPKQAIYSFRNADLHTYLQARSEAVAQYSLDENQRSTAPLLQGLNALFGAHPQAFMLPGLHYQPVRCGAKPRPTWHDSSVARAPLQLWALPLDEHGEPLFKPQALQAAARACAGEIARLLAAGQAGQVLHGGAPLTGGQVAVLVRSHSQGAVMRQALAALGVGSVELSQSSVFHSPDAEDLKRVLAAVLEPARESLLRAALATPLLGFDATALDSLAGDEARLLALVGRFTAYRALWLQRGVGVMLRSLVLNEGVNARLLSRTDGERRLTNLLHLQEALHQAAAEQATAADGLLRWLQAQRQAEGGSTPDSAQLRLASDRNLVQIVTIHKSKGLEYPVVFCPFLWDGHAGGGPDQREGRAYHDDQGRPVLDFRDEADIPGHAAIKAQASLERAAEQLRLIYVALTRAVQRCYLVVGTYQRRFKGSGSPNESLHSRLNWLVAGAPCTPEDWAKLKLTATDIHNAWQRLAQANPGAVDLQPLPPGPWAPLPPQPSDADNLAALQAPSPLPGAWWIGSYSSLSQGARHEGAALDHDARALPAEPLQPSPSPSPSHPLADDDILHFPRGPEAGNCLHAVFERVDFTQPATWPAAITAALQQQPPGVVPPALAPNTPLPGAGPLATVPTARRLVELEFMLPAAGLQAAALAQALRDHNLPVPALSFSRLQGYLRGFIDLVFEQQGRFYILDWKSNHLGDRPEDYAAAPLARAMAVHGYELQALLYTVALHRHLARRLPNYHYEQHFGGAHYLFVRGVRPQWVDGQGAPTGVHVLRPPLALVERLSAMFQPRASLALSSEGAT